MENEYLLESPFTPKDIAKILSYYRKALKSHSPESNGRIQTLEALFGQKMFLDIHTERNPCLHRVKTRNGGYLCRLAMSEMNRLGRKSGYDTSCNWLKGQCEDPLNPKANKQ